MPRGAHIRRINPRDSLEATIADVKRHRMARTGGRGAAFLIIGASIARQFEFLQRAWVNDATSSGSVL